MKINKKKGKLRKRRKKVGSFVKKILRNKENEEELSKKS